MPRIPPLRPLDAFPISEENGRRAIALRDPMGVVTGTLLVQPEAFFIACHFDGEREAPAIAEEVGTKLRGRITPESVESVAARFSERCLLHDARFEEAFVKARAEFASAPARPSAHAGASYPADPEELRHKIGGILAEAWDQPRAEGEITGLIAPHIDLERGMHTYARAFGALRDIGKVDRVVILGTSHGPTESLLVPTRKDYDTPLGPVRTDVEAVDRASEEVGAPNEFAHKNEHSIEFQTLFLRILQPNARIVPLLCGSLRSLIDDGVDPAGHPEVERAVRAIRATAADGKRTLLLAAADLAHVGPRFGGPELTRDLLEDTEKGDRAALDFAAVRDAAGWYRSVTEGGDPRNTCGLAPVYLMLRALDRGNGHLLGYRRCESPDQCVTIGAMAFVDGQ